jgi:FtsP/CotA-like multicopper oxidase with cupredoxin domain
MSHTMIKRILSVVVPLVAVMAVTGTAFPAEYYLRAEAFTKDMPDPSGGADIPVPMWGFARDDGFEGTEIEPVSVPGPVLEVPSGDTTLTIHLDNNLSEPISIVIPSQIATMTPVFFTDGEGRQRVRSFTHETPAGNATDVTYTWTGLKPGTYLYHSGTHPQVQVQMGLYGGVVANPATAGQAYDDASSAYSAQVLLLYSEVDPLLHQQVSDGSYGTTGMTSTIDYNPKYFLINGEPYTAAATPLPAGAAGDSVLIRFLNAGLRTHAPVLLGARLRVIAEDGNLYPFARDRCSLELPAGQTRDAIAVFSTAGTYPVYDRTLSLTNSGGSSPGGMLTYLQVAAP